MASLAAQTKGSSAAHNVVRDALQEMVINDAVSDAADARERAKEAAQHAREQGARASRSLTERYVNEEARGADDGNDSGSETDEEDRLLLDDDTALAEIRARRMAELKKSVAKKKEVVAKGYDTYRHIVEPDFLNEVKDGRVLCLFYKDEFETCKRVDQHMAILSPMHTECKFIKIDAEKAPFFVKKLNVRVLPTLIFFADGITNPAMQLMGFEGVENGELCSTRDLEEALCQLGFLNEAVMDEDVGPESLREGRDDDVGVRRGFDKTRARGAAPDQRSGSLYGFGRGED